MPVLDFNVDLRSAMCLDWHPNQSHVLLTGGQDNTIKVWNLIDNIEKKKQINNNVDRGRNVPQYLYKIQT